MKKTAMFFSAAAALALAALPGALAQTAIVTTGSTGPTATTETTTMAGTVTEFAPANQIVVRTTAGAPTTYSVTKQTTFVDETGAVVSAETIRPGVPTTVYYTTVNGQPTVSKVVVTKAAVPAARVTTETTETTTTTTGRK